MKVAALHLLFLLAVTPLALAQPEAVPSLRAGRMQGPLTIDGVFDEPDWAQAEAIDGLTMTEPQEGVPASARTRVRVIADRRAIAFAVECDDDPDGIVSFTTQRDGELFTQDYVRLVLGPFMDGRSGYIFAVNPSGARWDAIIKPGGEDENDEWDGIWEAATRRHDRGWTLEARIPVSSLTFGRDLTTWHFNVQRRIQRLQEVSRWASPSRNFQSSQTSKAGYLTDLPAFDLGLGLTLKPALVGGGQVRAKGDPIVGDLEPSLDLTQRIGSNLLTSITFNTDFAETEVDQRRTNLTRFPLFFPEKRTFFLDGSDIFEFGLGLGEDVIPFFSRRVGLVDGREIPIGAGAKVSGRMDATSLAVEMVRTRDTSLPGRDIPAATMGVARVSQNVGRESRIGAIATIGDPVGRDGAWTFGADLTYQTSTLGGDKNFLAGVWGLTMNRDGLGSDREAWGLKVDYPNDRWDAAFTFKDIGRDFDPSLGFVPRRGVRRYDGGLSFSPRPGNLIRQMSFQAYPSVFTDPDGNWESYQVFVSPVDIQFESGEAVELSVFPVGERLIEPFEIEDDVVIAPGSYEWRRYQVEAGTAEKRRISANIEYTAGSFYDGDLDQFELGVTWNPAALLTVVSSVERSVARLRAGRFAQTVFGTRVALNASPNLSISSFVQYDSISDSLGTNTRLRWTFDPRGDLFVIYNHNVRDRLDRWQFDSNQLLMKLQYALPF